MGWTMLSVVSWWVAGLSTAALCVATLVRWAFSEGERPWVMPWVVLGAVLGGSVTAVLLSVGYPHDPHHSVVSLHSESHETTWVGVPPDAPPVPAATTTVRPIDEAQLRQLVVELRGQTFPSHQLSSLRLEADRWWFRPDQAARIVMIFAHGSDQLGALEILKPRLYATEDLGPLLKQFTPHFGERANAEMILLGP